MSKTIELRLVFEDDEEAKVYLAAMDTHIAVNEFSNWLRNKLKHEDLNENDWAIYDKVRTEFIETMGNSLF